MNVALLIAASEYQHPLNNLPASIKDAELMNAILHATGKYDETLLLIDNANSASIKKRLTDSFKELKDRTKQKGEVIHEIFFYFSGHGEFSEGEFRYLLSDFDSKRRQQTSLGNSELDDLLRNLSPHLAVKVVDACHSGVAYIKDSDSFYGYLKGTKKEFKDCYFMYSSQSDQASYQDDNLSFFTRSFVEAISNHQERTIRYRDIIDYVSDELPKKSLQKPYFVIQADNTERFCTITESLKRKISEVLGGLVTPEEHVQRETVELSLEELVKQDAEKYCEKKELIRILQEVADRISNHQYPAEMTSLFELQLQKDSDYSNIPNLELVGEWISKNRNDYFATPRTEVITKEIQPSDFERMTLGIMAVPRSRSVRKIVGLRSTTDLPVKQFKMIAKPRLPNLQKTTCFIVPLVSKTHLRFFRSFGKYRDTDWEEAGLFGDIQWKTTEIELKDEAKIKEYIDATIVEFCQFTLDPIRERFGISIDEGRADDAESRDE